MTGYVEEVDSGMESVPDSSKDITPEKALAIDDNYDNEEDETLTERLIGLSEMFPHRARDFVYDTTVTCKNGIKTLYAFSRSAAWIFFSSSAILFAPILFEVERLQVQSAQLNQQKQVLLGPNTALNSPNPIGPGYTAMPPH